MSEKHEARRRFLRSVIVMGAAVPLSALASSRKATAQETPRLEESDPKAMALFYVHDASKATGTARGEGNRVCGTCRLYTGKADAEWGPCILFPGKVVSAKGWCSSWVAKVE